MNDATELRVAAILSQMNEMLENRLPSHLPEKRPDWQIWLFVAGVIFYAGISFIMVQQNSAAIEKILIEHKKDMQTTADERSSIEDALIGHINEENIRNLERSEKLRNKLEIQLRSK